MDCDRFEATLIDELYEELDELTSAAAKRHVAGCSRCASLIGGLRATRRVAVLPMVEPPMDLEDRILAAARNAQQVVPIGRRLSRTLSWAGSWAMRPQTAMAAVFLLMVGSSLLFVRRSKVSPPDSAMTVTAQGEPAPAGQASAATTDEQPVDSKLAAAAHGAGPSSPPIAAAPAATAAPSSAPGFEGALAYKDKERSLPLSVKGSGSESESSLGPFAKNAEAPAGAPLQHSRMAPPRARGGSDDGVVPSDLDKPQGGGAQAQTEQNRAPATDSPADLQAANTLRDTTGCGAAASSFDRISQQAWGTPTGYQATWEAAQCYRALGQTDQAQARYQRLLTVKQFATQAQQAIASISQSQTPNQNQNQVAGKVATRKYAAPAKPSAVTQVPQTQTPSATAPAAPPPATDQKAPAQQQQGL
jgi:hypothetical protein